MSADLRIDFDRPDRTYRVGEVVRGRVLVGPESGEGCERVTLSRRWKTHGRGNTAKGPELELVLHEGPFVGAPPWEIPFELATPAGPFTYRGELLNVDHYVRVELDVPWALDPNVEEEFILVPGPEPVAPPVELYRDPGRRRARSGCARGVGVALLVIGFVTLPLGLVLMAAGLLLLVPDVWRKISERKVGEVSAGLDQRVVTPGDTTGLRVRVRPPRDARIRGAVATLRCREVCVSGSGTDRRTHTEVLHERRFVLSEARALARGRSVVFDADVPVPEDAVYSLSLSDNEVLWDVTVEVDIPSWPDWKEELPIIVWPVAGEPALRRPAAEAGRILAGEGPAALLADPEVAPDSEADRTAGPDRPGGTERDRESEPSVARDPSADEEEVEGEDEVPLVAAVRALRAEPSFGRGRERRLKELLGSERTFEVEVERVERSFGAWKDAVFREGRTVIGRVAGTDVGVAVRFPAAANDEIDTLERGARRRVRGTVVEWQGLEDRPLVHADA